MQTEGNLVSELGFGPWRKANEEFIATFKRSYQLYEQRIGAPSSVDVATGGQLGQVQSDTLWLPQ